MGTHASADIEEQNERKRFGTLIHKKQLALPFLVEEEKILQSQIPDQVPVACHLNINLDVGNARPKRCRWSIPGGCRLWECSACRSKQQHEDSNHTLIIPEDKAKRFSDHRIEGRTRDAPERPFARSRRGVGVHAQKTRFRRVGVGAELFSHPDHLTISDALWVYRIWLNPPRRARVLVDQRAAEASRT